MNVAYGKIVTVKQTALKSWQYFYLMLMWSSPFTINGLTSLQTSLWSSPRDSWGNGHKGHETGWWPHCQWVMEPECESWLQILYPSNPWSKLRKNEREKRRNEGKKEEEQRAYDKVDDYKRYGFETKRDFIIASILAYEREKEEKKHSTKAFCVKSLEERAKGSVQNGFK